MALPAPKPSIDTCNACGKLFPRTSVRLCSGCAMDEGNRFELVRDYVLENDGASISDIARGTCVSGSDVRRFMDDGRLVTTSDLTTCTCAGVGTRCRACRAQLSSTFRDMEQAMQRERTSGAASGFGGDGHPRAGGNVDGGRTSYVRRIRRIGES